MLKKGKVLNSILAIVLIISLLAGCSKDNGNARIDSKKLSDGSKKDTLTVAIGVDITSIDPAGHNETITSYVTNMITSRLFAFDEKMNIIPELADKWEYITDTQLRIKIKEGIKFHDGSEMKAEDVKASLERAINSPKVAYVVNQVKQVDVVDDYTVDIITVAPFAPLIGNLIHPGCSILPKKLIDSGDFTNIIGSGPFTFVSRQSGNEVVLKKFPDYFDKEYISDFENLVFKVIPEGSSRTMALETGQVDLVTTLDTIDYDRVKENKDLAIVEMLANHIFYFAMNVEKEPFDNKLVRQAMNYAINKESVLEVGENGRGKVLDSFTPEGILGHVKNTTYKYDPEKAKELIKEAGYSDGELTFTINSYGDDRVAPVIQSNLADIGVNVKIDNMDKATFVEKNRVGDVQCGLNGWTTSADPDRFFSGLVSSAGIGSNNAARFNNKKIDELIKRGASTIDNVEREKIYNDVHTIGMDEAPWVPLYSKVLIMGGSSKLEYKDVLDPMGNVNFHKIKVKK